MARNVAAKEGEKAKQGAAWIRGITDVFNYICTTPHRCLITPRCREPRLPRMHLPFWCRSLCSPRPLVNRPENERIRLIPRKFHHWKFRHSGLPSGNTPFGNTIRFLYSSSRPTFNPLCNRTKHVYFCNLVEILEVRIYYKSDDRDFEILVSDDW